MVYQFESRVRYSEVDQDQNLTINGMINYFQDCSTFHSESIGLGIENLARKGRAWVLLSWQIVIHRQPGFGEKIRIQTWPYDFKGFYGYRNFTILDEEGKQAVCANSVWAYMDLNTGRPVKAAQDETEGYVLEERLDMKYASRKVPIPKESVEMEHCSVLKYQLDTNHHMNNGQYVLMAHEYLPEGFSVGQMRAEYKKQARLHDIIVPGVHQEEECCTVTLCGEDGQAYAVIAFDRAGEEKDKRLIKDKV